MSERWCNHTHLAPFRHQCIGQSLKTGGKRTSVSFYRLLFLAYSAIETPPSSGEKPRGFLGTGSSSCYSWPSASASAWAMSLAFSRTL